MLKNFSPQPDTTFWWKLRVGTLCVHSEAKPFETIVFLYSKIYTKFSQNLIGARKEGPIGLLYSNSLDSFPYIIHCIMNFSIYSNLLQLLLRKLWRLWGLWLCLSERLRDQLATGWAPLCSPHSTSHISVYLETINRLKAFQIVRWQSCCDQSTQVGGKLKRKYLPCSIIGKIDWTLE